MQIQNRRLIYIIVLLISLFPLWVACYHWQFLNDDTYITLTYSKSLVAGRGFVFNHPPPTLGTTTPFFALMIAALSLILPWVDISRIAVMFSALCWIGIVWTIYLARHSLHISDWQALIIGLAVIGSGWVGFLGMEAYLFAFLLVLSIVLYFRKQWAVTGVVVGLLFLTRGEGILMLPVFLLHTLAVMYVKWVKGRQLETQTIVSLFWTTLSCLAIILVWSIYAWFTFGYIFPNTLAAKLAQEQSMHWTPFLFRLLNEWAPTWGKQFVFPFCPMVNWWSLLVIAGLGYVIFKKRNWLIFLVWIGLYIAGYTLIRVAGYWWYQLPILFVLQVFAAFGLIGITEIFAKFRGKFRVLGYAMSVIVIATVVFLLVKPRIGSTLHYRDPRASSYLALSDWIRTNTQPSQSIAFIEIGYLGYYTDNRIVDLMGLVTPDVAPHIANGDFTWGFWNYEPDYYIYSPDFDWILASIRTDPRFNALYEPVATIPGPKGNDLIIYVHSRNVSDGR
jgi:hypothetical protein